MWTYPKPLIRGKLIRRYNRFLVDVQLDDGKIVTAHCTNTGSLKSCLVPGAPVLLSESDNPARKTRFTWESIWIDNGWVGVNTLIPNKVIYDSIVQGTCRIFRHFDRVRPEVKYGRSRFDLELVKGEQKWLVEIKNVTYREGKYALFPDAPTLRGQKHLRELMHARTHGYQTAMLFAVSRPATSVFAPARHIDPGYARLLAEAQRHGVKIYPVRICYSPTGARTCGILPVEF